MLSSTLPPSSIPIFTTVASYREWRRKAFDDKKSVGFVATMGALHEGHLSLVRRSLAANDLTVLSIFVNPTQFAPHEDLASYPRTLPRDLELLSALSLPVNVSSAQDTLKEVIRSPSAVFVPSVSEMYPTDFSQGSSKNTSEPKGTFVEVKGYGHQMEGTTRPTFFRGVATIVTKLFHVIEPTNTYFGQKDIQQALLLRRMVRDLLLSHPLSENLHIVPTARDPTTSLALSSRNAYLTLRERDFAAPALHAAMQAGRRAWDAGKNKEECLRHAREVVAEVAKQLDATGGKVEMKVDYIEMNDPESFDVISEAMTRAEWEDGAAGRPAIISGAMWVGRTRLIDNVVLGDPSQVGVVS